VILLVCETKIEGTETMAVNDSVDPAAWLATQLETSDPDLLRSMVKTVAEALMSAKADAAWGADYGQRGRERTNSRNGYRSRDLDTRAGGIEPAIPKLRQGSYFPDRSAGLGIYEAAGWVQAVCRSDSMRRSGALR
jgi:hypothetical protein